MKSYKVFGRISIVDIFIILCLIGLIVFLYMFSVPKSGEATGDNTRQYVIEVNKIDEGLTSKLQIGDEIFDSLKGTSIGTVVGVEEKPYEILADDTVNREFLVKGLDGMSSAYVTVEANMTESTNATTVGDFKVMVGSEVFVKTKNFAGNGYIVELER